MDYFERIEKRLDMPQADREQAIRELRSHFAQIVGELRESKAGEAEAEQQAAKRLGEPEELAARLSAAHHSASWKMALIAAFPCLALIVFKGSPAIWRDVGLHTTAYALQAGLPLIALTAVFMIGVVSALRGSYRPAWLASWLAIALSGVCYSGLVLAAFVCQRYWRTTGPAYTPEYMQCQKLVFMLPPLFLAAVTMALYILALRRRWDGLAWSTALALATWVLWQLRGGFYDTLGVLSMFLYIVLLASLAVAAFARHPSGRVSDAVLLVFLGVSALLIEFPWRTTGDQLAQNMAYLVGLSLMLATIVALHARASSSRDKLRILAAGAAAFWVTQISLLTCTIGVAIMGTGAICAAVILVTAFGPPLVASRWNLRLTLARRE